MQSAVQAINTQMKLITKRIEELIVRNVQAKLIEKQSREKQAAAGAFRSAIKNVDRFYFQLI
jgi:hypothetical protein